jgi:hypothetical protein
LKQTIFIALLAVLCVCSLFADETLDKADQLYQDGNYQQGYVFLEGKLNSGLSNKIQAEIYWRLARFILYIGDDKEDEGAEKDELLDIYTKGQELASRAIDLYPGSDAHYWHSSNLGRYGEIKGVLNSLKQAKPMREELEVVLSYDPSYPDAFYVLSRLYYLLPGGIISFGNKEYALSYARRAIALYNEKGYNEQELKVSYYKNLAEMLWERNWDVKKKRKKIAQMKKKLDKAGTVAERMAFYENIIGLNYIPHYAGKKLGDMDDREEAKLLMNWLRQEYRKITPNQRQLPDMKELEQMAAEWGI